MATLAPADAATAAPAAEDPHSGPLRRCLVGRGSHAREAMLRFVLAPDGQVVFDAAATLPGRGMWLSASGDVIDMAVKRGVFARAAKAQARTAPDLRGQVEAALRRRVMDLLGLARRGGGAVAGFAKAREWLTAGKAGLIVQAVDGSVEERARFVGGWDVTVVSPLDAEALGQVFARDHTVHAAIAKGRLARMIEVEAVRLAGVAASTVSGQ